MLVEWGKEFIRQWIEAKGYFGGTRNKARSQLQIDPISLSCIWFKNLLGNRKGYQIDFLIIVLIIYSPLKESCDKLWQYILWILNQWIINLKCPQWMLVKWIRSCPVRIFTVKVFSNISCKTQMDFAVLLKLSETLKPAERLVHFYKSPEFATKNWKLISVFLMFFWKEQFSIKIRKVFPVPRIWNFQTAHAIISNSSLLKNLYQRT